MELPPRARRIRFIIILAFPFRGTTSACAENTHGHGAHAQALGNYLRVRGEYVVPGQNISSETELPPRARRIHFSVIAKELQCGTTSACAENTPLHNIGPVLHGNYLRVRGEYRRAIFKSKSDLELPPRARRIPQNHGIRPQARGTTSACAENTKSTALKPPKNWNYLRVRGEYTEPPGPPGDYGELPPRARRILGIIARRTAARGTTSACAENT